MKNETILKLMSLHNDLVKDKYKCDDLAGFKNWLDSNEHDDYIEISSNETLTGAPYLLYFS